MKKAFLLLFAIISAATQANAQATASLDWNDPKLALHVPQEILQKFRNPDGCLSPESLIDTKSGPVRIDSLDHTKHQIYYHAEDGTVKATNNFRAFKTTKQADTLIRYGKARLTPGHMVGQNRGKDYIYVRVDSLGLPQEKLAKPIDVWDISVGEWCFKGEPNYFTGGKLVHNSCVQCSNGMTGTDQNIPAFAYLLWDSEYGPKVRGGSNPSRVASYAKARNVRIYNVTGKDTWDWMRWACTTGRGAAIGAAASHFQTLVGYDPKLKEWYVVNNNGDQRIQLYSDEAFRRLHLASGQWCVILDYPPAPEPPVELAWWQDGTKLWPEKQQP